MKCIVKILGCYKRRVPQEPKAFYLCPLDKISVDPDKPWFINMPVGINTLNNVVSKVSKSLDVTLPNSINHQLHDATGASCMFQKGVPEKIIAERTGHRSLSGLCAYEKATEEQTKAVCDAKLFKDSTFISASTTNDHTIINQGVQIISDSKEDEKPSKIPSFSGTFHGCTFHL